jgi:predicted nucleic acid-binding protein
LNRFVLDASIGLAWFLDDPVPSLAAQVWRRLQAGSRAIIPALWILEMANGLATAERRSALSRSHIDRCLSDTELVLTHAIDQSTHAISVRRVFAVASEFRLTTYDATYLETARIEQLPLATFDRALKNACSAAGVAIFS